MPAAQLLFIGVKACVFNFAAAGQTSVVTR